MKKIRKAICAVIALISIILMCGFADNMEISYISTVIGMILLMVVFVVCTYFAGGFTCIENEQKEKEGKDNAEN